MHPVRLSDVPGVVWTLAQAYAPSSKGLKKFLAAFAVPLWLVAMLLPGYLHHQRRVVVRVARRGARGAGPLLGRIALVLVVMIALVPLASASDLGAAIVLTVLAIGWLAMVSGLLVLLPHTIESLSSVGRVASSRQDRKADRARLREARWTVDSAASLEPIGGVLMMRSHLDAALPSGDVAAVRAATRKHAGVYRRLGFVPLVSQPQVLTYRVL
ncbi:hypothetical protein C8046_16655 [Serinibacter arcticus]|uniref:Uncharacterized protein n=1 Tax=Serinibacter arcticus TaxID=1655435 RepID=A0A2U1ZYL1_9MICO|nr:hypothetical protein [Serinibacter arcticus]PWD52030.1 hypothetical protein C8046_16655 [Serinibacter arcticus]